MADLREDEATAANLPPAANSIVRWSRISLFAITHAAKLRSRNSIAQVDLDDLDAIFLAGGQLPIITMINDDKLHRFAARTYESGTIEAVVYNGTCVLLKTRLSNGDLLVNGKTWTGFANSEAANAEPSSA